MHCGVISKAHNLTFTHGGSDIPLPPSTTENGKYTWCWDSVYDTVLDISFQLERPSFIGSVSAVLSENAVAGVQILVDGHAAASHRAETGRNCGGELLIPVGVIGQNITLRLQADLQTFSVERIEVLGIVKDDTPLIWPIPKHIDWQDGMVSIQSATANSADADEVFAAAFFSESLEERCGNRQQKNGVTAVLTKGDAAAFAGERYTISVTDTEIRITAATRLGLLYGVDTLLQICEKHNGSCPRFFCDDKPTKAFRGFHIGLPALREFGFTKRFLRYVLLPLRYNALIVEFAGGMRFDTHPEISAAWLQGCKDGRRGLQPPFPHACLGADGTLLEKEEVRELVRSVKELGLEFIPEIQSLGHVQYITYAHPEIAETEPVDVTVADTREEDARPAAFYHHCYCPSQEKSYEIIYDLIDEILEVTKPAHYVHMGHDEVYQLGICKKCRTQNPADLYARHVNAMHDYLAKRGLKMMIWADMLHPRPTTKYLTSPAIHKIPKDIILLDFIWYFHTDQDIEDELLPNGFQVGFGNLYSSHFKRYASRIQKNGIIGGQISTWVTTNESEFGTYGKFWDAMYLSEMLWNPETYDERNRTAYSYLIYTYLLEGMRDKVRGCFSPNGYGKTDIPLPTDNRPIPQNIAECLPQACIADGMEIVVNTCGDKIVFEHATLFSAPVIAWQEREKIGEYIIRYADGSEVTADVRYGVNVLSCLSEYGMPKPQPYYRHMGYTGTWFAAPAYRGKTENGDTVTTLGYTFENPYPHKKIASISYHRAAGESATLLLTGLKILTRKQQ